MSDEKEIRNFCMDINAVLAERYGKTVAYRVEYRVGRIYAGEPRTWHILLVNIIKDYPTNERMIVRHATYDEAHNVLSAIWHTIDILPGHA